MSGSYKSEDCESVCREKPMLTLTDINNDCFLNVLSFLDLETVLNIRRTSKTLKSLCDSAIPLLFKKITISGEKVCLEDEAQYVKQYTVQKLEHKIRMKSKMFSRANKLIVESPGENLEVILCAAKRHISPEKLKVFMNFQFSMDIQEEDKIDSLPSIGNHFPYLKKLSLKYFCVTDDDVSLMLQSLPNLEAFKGNGMKVEVKDRMNFFSHMGPNIKVLKWSDYPYFEWEQLQRVINFGGKGKQLKGLTLDIVDHDNSATHTIADFLCLETPNLESLHLRSIFSKRFSGLNKLSGIKHLRLDYWVFPAFSPEFSKTMAGVTKLILNEAQGDAEDCLKLFPNVEDLTIIHDDGNFTACIWTKEHLEKLTLLRRFALCVARFGPENFVEIVDTFEALNNVPCLLLLLLNDYIVKCFKEFGKMCDERLSGKITIIVEERLRNVLRDTNKICFRFVKYKYKEKQRLLKLKPHW